MNLNVAKWKEYKLTDLFIVKGGFYNKKPEHSVEGNIPFLASTENNNGITEYYSIDDIKTWDKVGNIDNTLNNKLYEGNCIAVTVNGSVCNAFYQKETFTCSHDITALYVKNHILTYEQALFICSIIMKEKYRWSYGRKPHDLKKFGRSVIKLPITSEETPDWKFMETYIKTLHYKPLVTNNSFNNKFHKIHTQKWESFRFEDLISSISKAKAHTKEDVNECKSYYKQAIPYVSRTEPNNSVDFYAENDDLEGIEKGNAIVIGDTTATISYQEKPFISGDHIVVIRADWLNKYTGLFIVSILRKEQFRYSYGRAYTVDLIKNTQIKLPTKNKKPDWEFMENYIKSLPYGDRI